MQKLLRQVDGKQPLVKRDKAKLVPIVTTESGRSYASGTIRIGFVVGWGEPPVGSMLTATAA